jgi:hypothetical protein
VARRAAASASHTWRATVAPPHRHGPVVADPGADGAAVEHSSTMQGRLGDGEVQHLTACSLDLQVLRASRTKRRAARIAGQGGRST